MTDLIVAQDNLPTTMEDLSKFVLVGRDKLQAVRAEISAMQNLKLAKEVREQKLAEGQEIGKLVLLAEARLGTLFNQMPKQQGARTNLFPTQGTSQVPVHPARKKQRRKLKRQSRNLKSRQKWALTKIRFRNSKSLPTIPPPFRKR